MKVYYSNVLFLALSLLFSLACTSVNARTDAALETVPYVDLSRYVGKWYEIASFPQRFSEGCVATTATYSLREDGKIDVLNECRIDSFNGPLNTAEGVAEVVDKETNAKLKVTFFWPFSGKYWIIDLGGDYEFAVVGHPSRNYFWILSRAPRLSEAKLNGILDRAQRKGFDLQKLQMTPQP